MVISKMVWGINWLFRKVCKRTGTSFCFFCSPHISWISAPKGTLSPLKPSIMNRIFCTWSRISGTPSRNSGQFLENHSTKVHDPLWLSSLQLRQKVELNVFMRLSCSWSSTNFLARVIFPVPAGLYDTTACGNCPADILGLQSGISISYPWVTVQIFSLTVQDKNFLQISSVLTHQICGIL